MFAAAVMRGETVKNDVGIDLRGTSRRQVRGLLPWPSPPDFCCDNLVLPLDLFRADDFFSPVHDC
jgi:hypothetical protein